jgi:hypothetical protein
VQANTIRRPASATLRRWLQRTLHRRHDRTIEILDTHNVIGTVDGDARHDLNDYLDTRRECSDVLRIRPLRNDGAYLDFTIEDEQ